MTTKNVLKLPPDTQVPNHVALIPDGNRRWARARGVHTLKGHKAGFERAVELARSAREMGIHTVTLWGFSSENWDRSPSEVGYLMKLYVKLINDYLNESIKDNVRLIHLGRKDRIPGFLLRKITEAEEKTSHNTKYIVNLAIDYGGHDELIRAVKKVISDGVPSEKVDKALIESYLDTKNQPYPYVDLLIRSSGEQRTSGLLLWQMEYAEMYWEEGHFPDFTPDKLYNAILDYSRRRRRFGGNDNLSHFQFKPKLTAALEVSWWRLANIPSGMKFREYAAKHLTEQWGLSRSLATDGAKLMVEAFMDGESQKWKLALEKLGRFYSIVREEVKLAFEPSLAAELQVDLWQKAQNPETVSITELDTTSRRLVSEVYRISDLQAAKAGHLMSLAMIERRLAKLNESDQHWAKAEDYLEKYYSAIKDRIA
jgi:undecaprenyl diphosphate synthase